jgi:moderate conductance mechanosensitive channel
MLLATLRLRGVSRWARGSGLEIVLLVIGSVLLARFASWFGNHVTARIDAGAREEDALVRSELAKHRHALAQVVTGSALVLIYFVTGILVLQRLKIPLTTLVAPATVVGLAVGFGAQRVVQDLLAGFFLITERQYGFGDVIRISVPGTTTGVSGTVEEVSLRVTRLRTINGELLMLPNGEIRQVTNLSRDWARAVIDVPVPIGSDIAKVNDILRSVGQAVFSDPAMRPLLLDEPTVMGVESIEVDFLKVRVVARTLPGKQFDVAREMRSRIAAAFLDEGISVPSALLNPTQAGSS